ncbi:MAG TPA: hypothetical protein DCR95_14010 [Desulfobacter sp.]|jgi:hypothetical protein|nr:hypothetical protein [Desulfobacter sp.]
MPCFEEHCRESLSLFGKSYAEVHLWLDEFAGTEKYGFRHRKVRHHEAGIAEACRLFGQEAGAAARQHIISDLETEGWGDGDPFPKDENDYVKIGFF